MRTGSTASQKALFFNLRKIKQQISDVSSEYMGQNELNKVSKILNVKNIEVQTMESRLSGGDVYLNQKIDSESDNDLMSLLNDERPNPEESVEDFNDGKLKKDFIERQTKTSSKDEILKRWSTDIHSKMSVATIKGEDGSAALKLPSAPESN